MKSGIAHTVPEVPVLLSQFVSEELHELVHGNTFPASPVERQLFYRNDLHTLYIYNGTAWVSTQAAAIDHLDDIGNVSVASPTSGHIFYYDGATSLWKAKAHTALKTGVHGVGANYIAKSSVDGLNVAAHITRHLLDGADPIPAIFLADIIKAANFIMIPTAAGWTEVTTGAGNTRQEPMRNMVEITDALVGSELAYVASMGFNIGGNYGRINWDKHLYLIFNYAIYKSEANLTRRVQVHAEPSAPPIIEELTEQGIGFQVVNLVMTGEAYDTARGTVALGNMVIEAGSHYKQIQVVIHLDPDTPAVNFYIDSSLVGSITNTDHIPSGTAVKSCYLKHSIDRPAGGASDVASVLFHGKVWQEL